MDRKKKRLIGNTLLFVLIISVGIFLFWAIKLYIENINEKTKEILEKTDTTYVSKGNKTTSSGLYVANLKNDIEDFIGKRDISSITYEIENENFYLEFKIEEDKDGNKSLTLSKIVDPELGINARMNKKNIEKIEYGTGNANHATVLKIYSSYDSDYFAMTDNVYYFLGSDIESISFMDGQFYYMSYNPNYLYLEEAKSCSKEVRKEIDGFNMNHYYYRYGKINFLPKYYQKLSSKTYTVENKCKEFSEEK